MCKNVFSSAISEFKHKCTLIINNIGISSWVNHKTQVNITNIFILYFRNIFILYSYAYIYFSSFTLHLHALFFTISNCISPKYVKSFIVCDFISSKFSRTILRSPYLFIKTMQKLNIYQIICLPIFEGKFKLIPSSKNSRSLLINIL